MAIKRKKKKETEATTPEPPTEHEPLPAAVTSGVISPQEWKDYTEKLVRLQREAAKAAQDLLLHERTGLGKKD